MKTQITLSLGIGLVIALSGCATVATTSDAWQQTSQALPFYAEGRLAVASDQHGGGYALFTWDYQPQQQRLRIKTPIGTTLGQLCQDAQGIFIQEKNGQMRQLSAAAMRELLPGIDAQVLLNDLPLWLTGRYVPDAHTQIIEGKLYQQGWEVSQQRRQHHPNQPWKVTLRQPQWRLRFIIDVFKAMPVMPVSDSPCATVVETKA